MKKRLLPLLLILLTSCSLKKEEKMQKEPLIGVKVYPNTAWFLENFAYREAALVSELKMAGFNLVSLPLWNGRSCWYETELFTKKEIPFDIMKFRRLCREAGITFAAIAPVFFDLETLMLHPEKEALYQNLRKEEQSWQRFVSPCDTAYRHYKTALIADMAKKMNPDFISLDFIRFPVIWENYPLHTHTDSILFGSWDKLCWQAFRASPFYPKNLPAEENAGLIEELIKRHRPEMAAWKAAMISQFVKDLKNELEKNGVSIPLIIHTLPWQESDFEGAIGWMAGQSPDSLGAEAAFLSPMLYWRLIGQNAAQISTSLDFWQGPEKAFDLLPSIPWSVVIDESPPNLAEWSETVNLILEKSDGIVLFHLEKVLQDSSIEGQKKLQILNAGKKF
jgi:hypothetical protein